MSQVIETRCPSCQGELLKAKEYFSWDYECKQCARSWIVLDDAFWLAGGDAYGMIFRKMGKEFIEVTDETLRNRLWDRVSDQTQLAYGARKNE